MEDKQSVTHGGSSVGPTAPGPGVTLINDQEVVVKKFDEAGQHLDDMVAFADVLSGKLVAYKAKTKETADKLETIGQPEGTESSVSSRKSFVGEYPAPTIGVLAGLLLALLTALGVNVSGIPVDDVTQVLTYVVQFGVPAVAGFAIRYINMRDTA
jgi:hypothetical protein